jgi:methylenetetrahydrofolate dehydrogenase (NADP+) / methenyltetrahydrofolate cyclohydrolase
MIVNGKAIAGSLLAEAKKHVQELGHEPVVRAVVMRPTPATESYLRIKSERAQEAGMRLDIVRLPDDAGEDELIAAAQGEGADAVIVQLPLPEGIDTTRVLDAIPLEKDADVLSSAAYERFIVGAEDALVPPVVGAVAEILERSNVEIAGSRAVIVGNGRLVGQPVRAWLARKQVEVLVLTEESFEERKNALKKADIVITGAGKPRLITPALLERGVALIDAGTSESGGAIVGDFDPACAEIASVFTPVPGGVGPIAVACLFTNVSLLLKKGSAQ